MSIRAQNALVLLAERSEARAERLGCTPASAALCAAAPVFDVAGLVSALITVAQVAAEAQGAADAVNALIAALAATVAAPRRPRCLLPRRCASASNGATFSSRSVGSLARIRSSALCAG